MQQDQIVLLIELAEKLKSKKRNKKEAIKSLKAAGILTSRGNFTKHYSSLNGIVDNVGIKRND